MGNFKILPPLTPRASPSALVVLEASKACKARLLVGSNHAGLLSRRAHRDLLGPVGRIDGAGSLQAVEPMRSFKRPRVEVAGHI